MQIILPLLVFMICAILLINVLIVCLTIFFYSVLPVSLFVISIKCKNDKTLSYILLLLAFISACFLFPALITELKNYKFQS